MNCRNSEFQRTPGSFFFFLSFHLFLRTSVCLLPEQLSHSLCLPCCTPPFRSTQTSASSSLSLSSYALSPVIWMSSLSFSFFDRRQQVSEDLQKFFAHELLHVFASFFQEFFMDIDEGEKLLEIALTGSAIEQRSHESGGNSSPAAERRSPQAAAPALLLLLHAVKSRLKHTPLILETRQCLQRKSCSRKDKEE